MDGDRRTQLLLEHTRQAPGRVQIAVVGAVDVATADQFGAALMDVLHETGVVGVDLDLSRLDFIDSIGVNTLVMGLRARAGGRSIIGRSTQAAACSRTCDCSVWTSC